MVSEVKMVGSYAKGTMIKDQPIADVVVILKGIELISFHSYLISVKCQITLFQLSKKLKQ